MFDSKKEAIEYVLREEMENHNVPILVTEKCRKESGGGTSYFFWLEACDFDCIVEAYTNIGDVEDGTRQEVTTTIERSCSLAETMEQARQFAIEIKEQLQKWEDAAAEKGL